jgi:UDP-GlcNAc:undecaprenyl-phosphate GlcNAc-1-phosphate transferase
MHAGAYVGAIAFLFVLASIPIVRAVCRRRGLYDSSGPLKIHDRPIPRFGGVSLALGLAAAVIIEGRVPIPGLVLWLVAFGLIWLAGIVDDAHGLSPAFRLAAQLASGVFLWLAGWHLPLHVSAFLGISAICAIVVFFANIFNFLDGSDGLAAGVTAIIAGAYIVAYGAGAQHLAAVVAWSLLGASTGFLVYNFPPATIFMGDSGSTVLGFCVAFLGIDFVSRLPSIERPVAKWTFPLLIAAVPLVDGIVVVLRRLRARTSPFQGDRRHYYDQMLAQGWSPRAVALASYGVTFLLAIAGLWTLRGVQSSALIFAGVVAAAIFLASIAGYSRSSTAATTKKQSHNLPLPD